MSAVKEKFEEASRLKDDLKASTLKTLWIAARCMGAPNALLEAVRSMYPEDQEITLIEWILRRRYGVVLAEQVLYPEDVG